MPCVRVHARVCAPRLWARPWATLPRVLAFVGGPALERGRPVTDRRDEGDGVSRSEDTSRKMVTSVFLADSSPWWLR